MRLIGLTGRSGSGKDYLGDLIFHRWGYHPVALADQIKVLALLNQDWSYGDVFHAKPPNVRTYIQEYGAAMREADPEYWLRALEAWIGRWVERWGIDQYVVTDVRYANELRWLQSKGGIVVAIQSDRANALTPEQMVHESELEIAHTMRLADASVTNDRHTLRNHLELQMEQILKAKGWVKP